jgi:hypothetical protein
MCEVGAVVGVEDEDAGWWSRWFCLRVSEDHVASVEQGFVLLFFSCILVMKMESVEGDHTCEWLNIRSDMMIISNPDLASRGSALCPQMYPFLFIYLRNDHDRKNLF